MHLCLKIKPKCMTVDGFSQSEHKRQLLAEYDKINKALERLDGGYDNIQTLVVQMHKDLPSTIRRELKLDKVDEIIRRMHTAYTQFEFYQDNKDGVEQQTLEDFSKSVVSHGHGSVRSDLNLLHSLVVPNFTADGNISILGSSIVALMAHGIKVC